MYNYSVCERFTFVNFVIRELKTYERNHLLLDGERERDILDVLQTSDVS